MKILTGRNTLVFYHLSLERANGALSKLRHFTTPEILRSVYYSIFNSHLNYGSQIWDQKQNYITNK